MQKSEDSKKKSYPLVFLSVFPISTPRRRRGSILVYIATVSRKFLSLFELRYADKLIYNFYSTSFSSLVYKRPIPSKKKEIEHILSDFFFHFQNAMITKKKMSGRSTTVKEKKKLYSVITKETSLSSFTYNEPIVNITTRIY